MNTIRASDEYGCIREHAHCSRCGCRIVYQNQEGLDGRCAECTRLDRFESIVERLIAALEKRTSEPQAVYLVTQRADGIWVRVEE